MSFCAIHLRAMEPEDIDAIYRWENDPSVWIDSAAHQPFSRHALSQFIEENSRADIYSCRQLRLMAEKIDAHVQSFTGASDPVGAPAVGCVDLFDFDPYHRRAGVGIIVDSQHRRHGIGLAILYALEDFAREHLQLHQLHCTIAANNIASIALFEKAAYQRCGTMKDWVSNKRMWTDAYMYQKLLS